MRGGALTSLTNTTAQNSGYSGVGLSDGGLAGLTLSTSGGNQTSTVGSTTLPFVLAPFRAVNHAGTAAVGQAHPSGQPAVGEEWLASGGTISLPPLPGDVSSTPEAVNNSGDAVGYSQGVAGQTAVLSAVVWHNGVPTDLNTLFSNLPYRLVEAKDISDTGYIVGDGFGNTVNTSPVWLLTPGTGQITGQITTPPPAGGGSGKPLSQVAVKLLGTDSSGNAVSDQTQTDANGDYSFTEVPGTYTVTPQPTDPSNLAQFSVAQCDGTPVTDASAPTGCQIALTAGLTAHADFTSGFTLTGTVKDTAGNGIGNIVVLIRSLGAGSTQTQATTDGTGAFKTELAPGQYVVETAPPGQGNTDQYYPVPSADCVPQNLFCQVNMNTDRLIGFASCVVPDPNGAPLPGSLATGGDIPGAKTFGSLEAVGCWKDVGDGKAFTSTQNVRLDGLDVVPDTGTTITLDPGGPTVTSDGPVQVRVNGLIAWRSDHLGITFSGGAGAQVNDIESGSASTGVTPNLLGWPINLGTGNPVGNNGGSIGLPWTFSPGTTAISLQAQVGPRFPANLQASWNFGDGKFERPDPSGGGTIDVPSVALQGLIELTNRQGLKIGGCFAPFNDKILKLFGRDAGTIALAQVCYDPNPTKQRWFAQALFELPSSVGFARRVNISLSFQNPKAGGAFDLQGYRLQNIQFQVGGLGGHGLPFGEGVFLQRLGGGITWDYSRAAPILLANVTAGLSLGPSIPLPFGSAAPGEAELLSEDGKVEWSFATDPTIWNLSGQLSVLHATPYEIDLGHGNLTIYQGDGPGKQGGRADIQAHGGLHLGVPLLGNLGGLADLTGFMVPAQPLPGSGRIGRLVQLEGNARFEFGGHFETFDVLLSNTVLGLCYHLSSGTEAGIYYDVVKGGEPGSGCDFGRFRIPTPAPPVVTPALTRADVAAARGGRGFRVARGLRAVMIAVRGRTGAPRVVLAGPGSRYVTPAPGKVRLDSHALILQDAKHRTTFFTIDRPRAGVWTVTPTRGSSAIQAIAESTPLPRAHITATTAIAGCREQTRYRMRSSAGETIDLYAQDGANRIFLARAHPPGGRLRFPLDPAGRRHGQIVAWESRGAELLGHKTLASYPGAEANGTEKPKALHVRHRILTWTPACAATSYRVSVAHAHTSTISTTRRPTVTLSKFHGVVTIKVAALTSSGTQLGATTLRTRLH